MKWSGQFLVLMLNQLQEQADEESQPLVVAEELILRWVEEVELPHRLAY
jgi:hypothetical protein